MSDDFCKVFFSCTHVSSSAFSILYIEGCLFRDVEREHCGINTTGQLNETHLSYCVDSHPPLIFMVWQGICFFDLNLNAPWCVGFPLGWAINSHVGVLRINQFVEVFKLNLPFYTRTCTIEVYSLQPYSSRIYIFKFIYGICFRAGYTESVVFYV